MFKVMQLKFKNPVRPDLTSTIQKRNRKLQAFFNAKNLDVRLHGDAQNPLMVLCGCVGLSSYVHNFDLRMLDKPNQGEVMKIFKLTEIIQGTREEIVEWLQQYPQMPLYRIQHKDSKLYLMWFQLCRSRTKTWPLSCVRARRLSHLQTTRSCRRHPEHA